MPLFFSYATATVEDDEELLEAIEPAVSGVELNNTGLLQAKEPAVSRFLEVKLKKLNSTLLIILYLLFIFFRLTFI